MCHWFHYEFGRVTPEITRIKIVTFRTIGKNWLLGPNISESTELLFTIFQSGRATSADDNLFLLCWPINVWHQIIHLTDTTFTLPYTLAFQNELEYCNADARVNSGHGLAPSFKNLVNFGLVILEFTRLNCVQQASISTRFSLTTFVRVRHYLALRQSVLAREWVTVLCRAGYTLGSATHYCFYFVVPSFSVVFLSLYSLCVFFVWGRGGGGG